MNLDGRNFVQGFWRQHQKTFGIAVLLLGIFFFTGLKERTFWSAGAINETLRYTGLFGILAVAAAIVIATGGIDLSMGALVALAGVMLPRAIMAGLQISVAGFTFFPQPISPASAMLLVVVVALLIGLLHGLLITKLDLQPFLVTLCGLFIYRGFARIIAGNDSWGFENKFDVLRRLSTGNTLGLPTPLVILLVLAVLTSILLHRTVYGRALLALGRNENAARFSGIATNRIKIIAYILCAIITAFGGMMFVFKTNSAVASNYGMSYELYAIAGAVLGGCSLRGGECSLAGVVLGAALVQFSQSAVLSLGVPDEYKFVVVGSFILVGVIVDEVMRRVAAARRSQEGAT
ncbi:MAG: ABC transporter permease [Verrucomicrobiales bacterium]